MKENTFSALTDIDSRLLRTILILFRKPTVVLYDRSGMYTTPVRYILTMTGLVFFVYLFIDSFLTTDDMSITHWRTPLREQLYHEKLANIASKFATFIFSITLVPGIWFASKLLFFKKGSILFFYRVTLYFIAQATLVGFFLSLPSVWLDTDFSTPFMLLMMAYTTWFFLTLSLNPWYYALPKILLLLPVAFFSYSSLSPMVTTLVSGIMIHPERTYDVPVTSNDLFTNRTLLDNSYAGFFTATVDEDRTFFIDEYKLTIGMLAQSGKTHWSKSVDNDFEQHVKFEKLIPIPEHQLLVVVGDSLNHTSTDFLLVFNYAGDLLLRYDFKEDLMTEAFQLISTDSSGISLLVPYPTSATNEYTFREAYIFLPNMFLAVSPSFTTPLPIFQIYSLGLNGSVASVVKKDRQFVEFGIARYDSANTLMWFQQTYDKNSPYDPPVPQAVVVDTGRQEIVVQYSIANDTTDYAWLQCLDLQTGNLKWKNSLRIPGDFTEYKNMVLDGTTIYLAGETHRDVVGLFSANYHAATVVYADRNTGKLKGYKHFGNDSFGGHTRFSSMLQTPDELIFLGTENKASWFLFGKPEDENYQWTIPKSAL